MDRTSDFGSDSEGSNPSAVTHGSYYRGFFVYIPPITQSILIGVVGMLAVNASEQLS